MPRRKYEPFDARLTPDEQAIHGEFTYGRSALKWVDRAMLTTPARSKVVTPEKHDWSLTVSALEHAARCAEFYGIDSSAIARFLHSRQRTDALAAIECCGRIHFREQVEVCTSRRLPHPELRVPLAPKGLDAFRPKAVAKIKAALAELGMDAKPDAVKAVARVRGQDCYAILALLRRSASGK